MVGKELDNTNLMEGTDKRLPEACNGVLWVALHGMHYEFVLAEEMGCKCSKA